MTVIGDLFKHNILKLISKWNCLIITESCVGDILIPWQRWKLAYKHLRKAQKLWFHRENDLISSVLMIDSLIYWKPVWLAKNSSASSSPSSSSCIPGNSHWRPQPAFHQRRKSSTKHSERSEWKEPEIRTRGEAYRVQEACQRVGSDAPLDSTAWPPGKPPETKWAADWRGRRRVKQKGRDPPDGKPVGWYRRKHFFVFLFFLATQRTGARPEAAKSAVFV